MEKCSLPMMFYLNDGDIDKAGYQRLKQRAFAKAIAFHPNEQKITLGPNAVQKNQSTDSTPTKESHGNTDLNGTIASRTSSPYLTEKESISSKKDDVEDYYDPSESSEKKEERLIRNRILASLENMCVLEAQEKVNNMRKEWIKREEETMCRLQKELDSEIQLREERKIHDFNQIYSTMFQKSVIEDAEMIKAAEEALNKKSNEDEYLFKMQEMSNMAEILVSVTSSHKKFQNICKEISNCLKFSDEKFLLSISNEMELIKKVQCQDFPALIKSTELRPIPTDLVTKAEALVTSSTQAYESIKYKMEKRKLELQEDELRKIREQNQLEEEKKKEAEKKHLEEENAKDKNKEVNSTMEEDATSEVKTPPSENVDPEIRRIQNVMAHYQKYLEIYKNMTSSLKEFMADDSLKKFRSECQKAVNVPVNAISAVSAAHLNDKLKKLTSLLSGQQVFINSKLFNPSQHPLGVKYCTYLLAEKIVRQGEDVVSVKSDAAFPIAVIVLAIWGQFPEFGNLLISVFHKVCPYLIPIYWVQEEGMSDEEYYRKLGFKYTDSEREDINMFLKRQGGVVRLYFSIVVSQMKDKSMQHPMDLNEAWRWLAMFSSLEPSAEITATLLFDMLDVTGFALLKTYRKQFFKLIYLICVHYLPKIEKITPVGKGGPVSRLKSFLEQLIRSQSLKPPKGLLPANFW